MIFDRLIDHSASVERLFSKAGLTLGKLRCRLTDKNLEKNTLLQSNKKFCP